MRNSSPRSSSDAASASACRALTSAASCLVRASSSCFSSPAPGRPACRGLLLGTQALELAQRGAVARVGVEGGVHQRGVVTTGDLAGTDDVGVVAQEAEVDHASSLTNPATRRSWSSTATTPLRCRHGLTSGSRSRRSPSPSWPSSSRWGCAPSSRACGVRTARTSPSRRRPPTTTPRARRVRGEPSKPDVVGLEAVVRRAFADAALPDPLWFETTIADPGVGQTRAALAQGRTSSSPWAGTARSARSRRAWSAAAARWASCPSAPATSSRATSTCPWVTPARRSPS